MARRSARPPTIRSARRPYRRSRSSSQARTSLSGTVSPRSKAVPEQRFRAQSPVPPASDTQALFYYPNRPNRTCTCVNLRYKSPVQFMPARVSETFILRTYPLRESDLIVSFLTRDQGKLRGVARRARRPKNPFGAGLERLSQVRVAYFQRENRELVNLDSCEIIRSQFDLMSSYETGVALDYFAEVT